MAPAKPEAVKPVPSRLVDDCFRPGVPLLRHGEAVALLKSRIVPITATETVPLADASGRILAARVQAPHPVPAHTNSAVDGYAFAHAAYDGKTGATFPVAGRAAAGHPLATIVAPGAAVRIFTGAVMPAGVDSVVMQEEAVVSGGSDAPVVRIGPGLKLGANVRRAGEDVAEGEALFEAGHLVRPQDLAALASIGVAEVSARKRLRVAIVSTGDEVIAPGSRALAPGEVFDANAPMLDALARTAGCAVEMLGIWRDKPAEIERRLREVAGRFDVILTSGGASQGEEDHLAAALDRIGTRHLWQLAVKPGRPMMFGQIASDGGDGHRAIMVGLPGNPVAVFVCFLMYVYPMLRALAGAPWPEPRRFRLPAAFAFPGRKVGRREFWRGMLIETPHGLAVDKFARDGSGLISGLRAAGGLIDVPEDVAAVVPGDLVGFIPFSEFGILGI